jgi:hypothetical protein
MLVELRGGKTVSLAIVPLRIILPHEDTIPELLKSVTADLLRTGLQRDPILIDKKSKVVLDGMHRRAALQSADARFALCAEYDYESSAVKLERWLRYFVAPEKKMLNEIIDLFSLGRVDSITDAIQKVDEEKTRIALLSRSSSFISKDLEDLGNVYQRISACDSIFRKAKVEIQFIEESRKLEAFTSDSVYVIYPSPLSKKDVIDMAMSGRVFPFKTTRHVVPVRPMGVCFPTDSLKRGSQMENDSELDSILSTSEPEIIERDVWYEGRNYSEPIVVFRRSQRR